MYPRAWCQIKFPKTWVALVLQNKPEDFALNYCASEFLNRFTGYQLGQNPECFQYQWNPAVLLFCSSGDWSEDALLRYIDTVSFGFYVILGAKKEGGCGGGWGWDGYWEKVTWWKTDETDYGSYWSAGCDIRDVKPSGSAMNDVTATKPFTQ
jgi:hypothetical protein